MSAGVWATRTAQDARAYWQRRDAGYRVLLASMIASQLAPFDSLVEVGCHACANLWAIRQQYPRAQLYGIDPSQALLDEARLLWNEDATDRMTSSQRAAFQAGHLPESLGLELFCGTAPGCVGGLADVLASQGLTVDIGLTVYTLAYLSIPDASATLSALCDMATKAVVLFEPSCSTDEQQPIQENGCVPAWARDYQAWFREFRPDWAVTSSRFPGPQQLNACLIARRP